MYSSEAIQSDSSLPSELVLLFLALCSMIDDIQQLHDTTPLRFFVALNQPAWALSHSTSGELLPLFIFLCQTFDDLVLPLSGSMKDSAFTLFIQMFAPKTLSAPAAKTREKKKKGKAKKLYIEWATCVRAGGSVSLRETWKHLIPADREPAFSD